LDVTSFRYWKERNGANIGNGASLRKGHGKGSWGDFIGKFGDDENIKGAEREERGLELAAQIFDGIADGFETIHGIVKEPVAGVCGVTDLMAEEGHRVLLPGEGCNTLKVRLWDEEVKRRKDEKFEWDGVTD